MGSFFKFENLDMYGQSIKFTYNKSNHIYSHCGLIVSMIISTLIIIYSCLLVFDRMKSDQPNINITAETSLIAPKLYLISDLTGYFDSASPYFNLTDQEKYDTAFIQLSFSFQNTDTLELIQYDPSYFYFDITYASKNKTFHQQHSLFFDYCRRFAHTSNTQYDVYKLNETFCLYSPFILHGNNFNDYFKTIYLSIKKCRNNTILYEKKQSLLEYQRLEYVYNQMKNRSYVDSKIFFESNETSMGKNFFYDESYNDNVDIIESANLNLNSNLKFMNDINETRTYPTVPYVRLINNNTDTFYTPVICKSDDEIANRIYNLRMQFYYLESEFNSTSYKHPITTQLYQDFFYPNKNILKEITIFLTNDKLITYDSLLPSSMLNKSQIDYFIHQTDNYDILYYDPSDDLLLGLFIKSSNLRYIYVRTFINILDILGIIGGLARIFIVFGFCFVSYVAYIKKKEKFINETYNVVDPKNLKKIQRSFKNFIEEISEKKEYYENTNFKDHTFLEEYFCGRLNEIAILQQTNDKSIIKYEILYDVFKQVAYSGFAYTYLELFMNVVCFCCLTKRLRHKNFIFKKACKELEKDNDFRSIFRTVQEFEIIKKCFLDTGQYSLLNAVTNPAITWRSLRTIKESPEMKIRISQALKNTPYIIRTNKESYDKIIGLEIAIDEIFKKSEENETDSDLLKSLIMNQELADSVNEMIHSKYRKSKYQQHPMDGVENEDKEVVDLNEDDIVKMIKNFH